MPFHVPNPFPEQYTKLHRGNMLVSKRLVASYVLDWIVIM